MKLGLIYLLKDLVSVGFIVIDKWVAVALVGYVLYKGLVILDV